MSRRNNLFQMSQFRKPKLNKFDLSHEKKLTCPMGQLVPIMWRPVLPGDVFRGHSEIFIRFAPMLAPIMHRINVFTHTFFVPNRLIWNEWEDFITGGQDGESAPIHPYIISQAAADALKLSKGQLADYLGIPVQNFHNTTSTPVNSINFNALPFRAYQVIWDNYYRDPNLEPELDMPLGSGAVGPGTPEIWATMNMRDRCWEKDYFTSALPWPQRGPEVLIPMEFNVTEAYKTATGDTNTTVGAVTLDNAGAILNATPVNIGFRGDNASTAVNDLRTAIKIQQWMEKSARGGSRFTEIISSNFGVESPDARLQRPEYLGGSKDAVKISEVLQTAEGSTEPVGQTWGHGIAGGITNGYSKRFLEHGIIMTIMSILPRTAYQDGIPKELHHVADKFDYAWPDLAHLGEQEVKSVEVYFDDMNPDTNTVPTFGYQSRYVQYKQVLDSVHGEFRDTLDFWHMARKFDTEQFLTADFTASFDVTDRIFAVTAAEDKLRIQVYNQIDALRPLPYFGTPSF